MDQVGIIRDLIFWIDNHLDKSLTLDDVAAKAGYSKWHLQRMFKESTGQSLGSYIRKRRLTKAALALRLTSKSILEIALQYHFDSQQTFTRAFKRQFSATPASYRRADEWNLQGFCSPLTFRPMPLPEVDFVTLPSRDLIGIKHQYTCTLEQISDTLIQYRAQFWEEYLRNTDRVPERLYGLHQISTDLNSNEEQNVFYTTAVEVDTAPPGVTGCAIPLPSMTYARFKYQGTMAELQRFIIKLHLYNLPALNIIRGKGTDFEIFYPETNVHDHVPAIIRCDYFVPVVAIPPGFENNSK